jgi:hypothetical protein
MISKIKKHTFFIVLLLSIIACEEGPKMTNMPIEENSGSATTLPKRGETSKSTLNKDVHKVVVNEVLPTSKYVYLNVNEGDRVFWIAVVKQDIEVGEHYVFQGGLLKTNFESKEYNRMFEEIYLVTNLIHDHGDAVPATISSTKDNETKIESDNLEEYEIPEGTITIAEIVDNAGKYEGKTVQLSGNCIKINPNIMKRNWIHLKDGSLDKYDMIVTTNEFVPEGSHVTLKGVVSLNKDFGAGYTYEIIIENAIIVR